MKTIKPQRLPNNVFLHNRGCGISYLQRNNKIKYSDVPENSWFLRGNLCDKIAIDIPWSELELEEGKFCWDSPEWEGCFKSWLDAGFKVHLKVRGMDTLGTFYNQGTPQWVFDAGAKFIDEPIELYRSTTLLNNIPDGTDTPIRYPVYWDPVYLEKTENFVKALGERYNGHTGVESVSIAHMGRWGEMHVAEHSPNKPWFAAGFSLKTYLKAHRQIIDMYLKAFPETQLSQSIGSPIFDVKGADVMSSMENYEYLVENGVIIKFDGLGMSYAQGSSPYLCELVSGIYKKYRGKTKLAFENLVLPEALEEGLQHSMTYWQRGGESAGLGIMNVEKQCHLKDKKIYSFYKFFKDKYDKITIEDEKNIWRSMALKCGYRLGLTEVAVGGMASGKSFTTVMKWFNSGSAACHEKFKVKLSLFDSSNGKEIWNESQRPGVGCSPASWDSGKTVNDELTWSFPSNLKPSNYELRVGIQLCAYNQEMMQLAIKGRTDDGMHALGIFPCKGASG